MIEITRGNVLTAGTEALVNTVNTVGVMGKGIALQFKRAWPEYFAEYKRACDANDIQLGRVWTYRLNGFAGPDYILSFPTKGHWRERSRLENIDAGLADLVDRVLTLRIGSIAIPPLGCGNGGLEWAIIRPRIEAAFAPYPDIAVMLFEPGFEPRHEERPAAPKAWKWTRVRAAMAVLMDAYSIADYRLSLLEAQKLAYFLQSAGEPMNLDFKPRFQGPYADALRHLLLSMEGHVIFGADGSSRPSAEIRLIDGATSKARAVIEGIPDAKAHLDRVRSVIEGFETPYGMELLATVHWVATARSANGTSAESIVEGVRSWSADKGAKFSEPHITTALNHLRESGWLQLAG